NRAAHPDQREQNGHRSRQYISARTAASAQPSKRYAEQDGDETKAVRAEHRRALQNFRYGAPAISGEIPRETRQDMTAQILGERKRGGERKHPRRSVLPEAGRHHAGERGEQRQPARQQRQHERYLPGVVGGIDFESVADPVEAHQKLAKAESPTCKRETKRTAPGVGNAFKQQHQYGIAQKLGCE